jgi:DNA-binding transcriptional MocR family regulator
VTAAAIAAHSPRGTGLSVPQGGMLLWVEMPAGVSGMDVFETGLRQGIRVAPGAMFSNGTRYDHFLRISCGQRITPEVSHALVALARIVEERTG